MIEYLNKYNNIILSLLKGSYIYKISIFSSTIKAKD